MTEHNPASILNSDQKSTYGAIPKGFDSDNFTQVAKENFALMQKAWDNADLNTLKSMMNDAMFNQIKQQLQQRQMQQQTTTHNQGISVNCTEIVTLEASLLGIEEFPAGYLANIEFSGVTIEEIDGSPMSFCEIWRLFKPKNESSGWLVAGIESKH